ncbi:MAG: pyridoxamine 5'-phosphate oxidase family protein [Oscillospiraceae bacterium]
MEKLNETTAQILQDRFGKDSLIALATCSDNMPHVRTVDAYYDGGAFYIITHALSGKMKQLAENPAAAVSGEWFTGHGVGENLGYFGKPENAAIAEKLRAAFDAWIDNGHNDFSDQNTIVLRIRLTDGVLYSNGSRYEIDFT